MRWYRSRISPGRFNTRQRVSRVYAFMLFRTSRRGVLFRFIMGLKEKAIRGNAEFLRNVNFLKIPVDKLCHSGEFTGNSGKYC